MAVKRVLYVFDEKARERKYSNNNENTEIFLCPLTGDQECISSVIQRLRSKNNCEIKQLNFSKLFNEKAFSERDVYIRFIAEFSERKIFNGKNLKEYFKIPFKNHSFWWFSLIAEKNTLKTNSYHKLARFLTILDLQRKYSCHEIWLDINDAELAYSVINQEKIGGFTTHNLRKQNRKSDIVCLLANFISAIKYFLVLIRRTLILKRKMRDLNTRQKILQNSRFLLVTYFPLVDEKQLKNEKFINRYYQPLQRALERKFGGQFTWLALSVDIEDFDWNKSVELGRQVNKWGYPLYFMEEWLTFRAFLIIILEYFHTSIKFLLKLPNISREFKYSSNGMNIWQIYKNDWYSSFCGVTFIHGIWRYLVFSRMFRRLKEDTVITYLAEMHAWEKALNMAAQETNKLKVIGIQHTSMPLLFLHFFNYKTELGDNVGKMPKPEYLACVGNIPAKLFQNSGWDKHRIFVLGAVRFQYLKQFLENEIPWKRRKNKVVVILSINSEESKELLSFIYHAFKDQKKYEVLIKAHPACPIVPMLNSLKITLNKDIFKITDTPIYELFPISKVAVITGSTAALESIACQCPVIIPKLPNLLDMNPLTGISNLAIYVNNPEELKKVADRMMDSKESPLVYEECKKFIQDYFDFPSSEENFLKRIEKLN